MELFAAQAIKEPQDCLLKDGTSVQLVLNGDEFYHYWTTLDGFMATENEDGTFSLTDQLPDPKRIHKLHSESTRRQSVRFPAQKGQQNAPRGLFLLCEFQDLTFTAGQQADFDSLMNAAHYIYNGATGSVKQYFRDQSNGQYDPIFDVIGPIRLPHNYAYYGTNTSDGYDQYMADFVIDACLKADSMGADFSQYDANNDGVVDFIFLLFAGKGENAGGTSAAIWPHKWDLPSILYYGFTHQSTYYYRINPQTGNIEYKLPILDGKYLNIYACSQELDKSGKRAGIGTPTHEFSHVLGLVDCYITGGTTSKYYGKQTTPGSWSLMDAGNNNNNGNTPPNYSAFDKYSVGWITPEVLSSARLDTLPADGISARQINSTGSLVPFSHSDTVYYLENRQMTGWDAYLPGHGLVVWKVCYDATNWTNNVPNDNDLGYTIVSADGGKAYTTSGTGGDRLGTPFPGSNNVTSFTPLQGYPLNSITEQDGVITYTFISSPATDLESTSTEQTTGTYKYLQNGQLFIVRDGVVYTIW